MDFLLYFYILLFGIILLLPFVIFYLRFQSHVSPFGEDEDQTLLALTQKKRNLLDSLKDVRSDYYAKKLTEEEFQTLSLPFLQELDDLESKIGNRKKESVPQTIIPVPSSAGWKCGNCGSAISIPNANFCPNCGTSRLA
ncbi:zinc ribbon domain-containing protein [Leptospira idonii]|uniref:Zinc ribbon domain-containing protein n=1 Tax=Leptospira idonii TaxID=1193500 RepID=A0A4R9M1W7_9LEPT|nr:zinc ribbon domain-containing protein [Leptospira idonii]TGN20730.1 zinc ribbon domain-containing protein [Leptospira idonii]